MSLSLNHYSNEFFGWASVLTYYLPWANRDKFVEFSLIINQYNKFCHNLHSVCDVISLVL